MQATFSILTHNEVAKSQDLLSTKRSRTTSTFKLLPAKWGIKIWSITQNQEIPIESLSALNLYTITTSMR